MKRWLAFFLAVLSCLLMFAACAKPNDNEEQPSPPQESETPPQETPSTVIGSVSDVTPSPEPEPTPSETPEPEPEPTPEFVNPLTGIGVESDISMKRPTAVVFNNLVKAIPQSGINSADIIIEALAEGGITRILGIFMDVTEVSDLGSIRSMRPYFIDFAKCLNPIYIHAGGSDDAYIKIKNEKVTNIDGVNGNASIFYRDAWRKSNMGYEHSLMVETARIPAYLEKSKIKTEISETADIGFDFGESSAKNGADAMKFTVKFSSGKSTAFSYSAEDELYYPGQYGVKMTDSLTGKQLSCTNVLVLKMSTKTLDSVGRVAITSTGSGEGMYFSGGKYIDITWSRSSTSEPFSFKTSDGSALTMLPGVTYVCTIPTNMDVTIS